MLGVLTVHVWSLRQTGTELLRFSAVLDLQLSLGSGTDGSHPKWQVLAYMSPSLLLREDMLQDTLRVRGRLWLPTPWIVGVDIR